MCKQVISEAEKKMLALKIVAFFCVCFCVPSNSFYIPGVLPVSYSVDQQLNIKVNSLTSMQGVMPFNFYSVKTCEPSPERRKNEKKTENLGEILWGDRIEPSEYYVQILRNVSCQVACKLEYSKADIQKLEKFIEQQYRGNMVLDNLPVAQETQGGPRVPKLLVGYPLGVPKKLSATKKTHINNHLHFKIALNDDVPGDRSDELYRIVGFYVSAHSVDYSSAKKNCDEKSPFNPADYSPLTTETQGSSITWSYSVSWIDEPDLVWATRWDIYMQGGENDDRIHWFSIVNSLLVILFLSAMVAMIMMRTLHKDFNRYNDPTNENAAQEETGWKMVHGDVFRTPSAPVLLSALVGSGAQLILMVFITLVFATVGFLSPSNRGGLLTAVILFFVLLGALSGNISARMLKFFKLQSWANAFACGFLLPGTCMLLYLGLNMVQWVKQASSAIPFTTLLLLFALWLCVAVPLHTLGAAIGFRRHALEVPCQVNAMPRFIPPRKWYLKGYVIIPIAGVLPFGAAFIELVYILSSFWQGRLYYVFGFLALVFVIVVLTCAEVSVVVIYFQLCYDDYLWWWRSFLITASSGLHLFLYSLYYLYAYLSIRQPSSIVLYVGYMFFAGYLFSIFTGSVGFFSSFAFVRKIYRSIKIE